LSIRLNWIFNMNKTTSCEVNLFWNILLLNRRFGWSKPLSRPKIFFTRIKLKDKNLKISYLVFHKITTIQKYIKSKMTENIKPTNACASINLLQEFFEADFFCLLSVGFNLLIWSISFNNSLLSLLPLSRMTGLL